MNITRTRIAAAGTIGVLGALGAVAYAAGSGGSGAAQADSGPSAPKIRTVVEHRTVNVVRRAQPSHASRYVATAGARVSRSGSAQPVPARTAQSGAPEGGKPAAPKDDSSGSSRGDADQYEDEHGGDGQSDDHGGEYRNDDDDRGGDGRDDDDDDHDDHDDEGGSGSGEQDDD